MPHDKLRAQNTTKMYCRSILLLVANGSSQLHKIYLSRCTAKNPWWGAERLPETCRVVVVPIKLKFGASVGFIHKEYTQRFPQAYIELQVLI